MAACLSHIKLTYISPLTFSGTSEKKNYYLEEFLFYAWRLLGSEIKVFPFRKKSMAQN